MNEDTKFTDILSTNFDELDVQCKDIRRNQKKFKTLMNQNPKKINLNNLNSIPLKKKLSNFINNFEDILLDLKKVRNKVQEEKKPKTCQNLNYVKRFDQSKMASICKRSHTLQENRGEDYVEEEDSFSNSDDSSMSISIDEPTVNFKKNVMEVKLIKMKNTLEKLKFDYIEELQSMMIKTKKKVALFEVEKTLVSIDYSNLNICDLVLTFDKNSKNFEKTKIGLNIRPHLIECLSEIKLDYILVIYSSLENKILNRILDIIDPTKTLFSYRLNQEHCHRIKYQGDIFYVKDLNIFKGIDSDSLVLIDNYQDSFQLNIENKIFISPFKDSKNDVEMIHLSKYLMYLSSTSEFNKVNENDFSINQSNFCNEDSLEMSLNSSIIIDSDSSLCIYLDSGNSSEINNGEKKGINIEGISALTPIKKAGDSSKFINFKCLNLFDIFLRYES